MNNPISQEVSSQISALYRAVILDDESKGYHDACKKYRDEVAAYAAKQDPTADEKEEFYKTFVLENRNGIATIKQAWIGKGKTGRKPSTVDLEPALRDLVSLAADKGRVPLGDIEEIVDKAWEKFCAITNAVTECDVPSIFNRAVAAVLGEYVSVCPTKNNFFKVYDWFVDNRFLAKDWGTKADRDWFRYNVKFMKFLSDCLADVEAVDCHYIGIFVRKMYECIDNGSISDLARRAGIQNMDTDGNGATEKKDENKGDEMSEEIRKLLESSHQVILTGAPGTGKTYLAKKVALAMLGEQYTDKDWDKAFEDGRVGFCQFHPSYDYSDFVEGLRPVTVGTGENPQVGFKRMDGVFKAFCKKALNCDVRNWDDIFDKAWQCLLSLIDMGPEDGLEIPLRSRHGSFSLERNVSGRGLASKMYKDGDKETVKGAIKFFSREQLYNVFRGEAGVPSGGHDSYRKAIVDYMKDKCGLVEYNANSILNETDANSPYVFIIDEINRGDISKIFGELFFSIDPGYRGKQGRVNTQYQNLVEPKDEFEEGFYVPENVYIIGTMNDIDRSVESMDFAIRRRFVWKEVPANSDVLDSEDARAKIPDEKIRKDAMSRMNALNNEVVKELGSEYAIGPAYFLKMPNLDNDFKKLWTMNLEPLLREYLRGNSKDEITAKMNQFVKAYFSGSEIQKNDDNLNAAGQNGKDASGESAG